MRYLRKLMFGGTYTPAPEPPPPTPTLWTPSQLPSSYWFDGSDAATKTLVATKVSAWANKNNGSISAVQATDADRPTNAASFLTFSAATHKLDYASAPLFNSAVGATLCIVCRPTSFPLASNVVLHVSTAVSATPRQTITMSSTFFRYVVRGTDAESANTLTDTTTVTANNTYIISATTDYTNRNLALYINGELKGSVNYPSMGTAVDNTNAAVFRIGHLSDTSNFTGDVFQVVAVPSFLGTTDRQKLEGWAAHYTGNASLLVAGHPYKVSPPNV